MKDLRALVEVPLDVPAWSRPGAVRGVRLTEHLGRACLAFAEASAPILLPAVRLTDGVVEADIAVAADRAFHGVVWRADDAENFESFFVRPHQVGNPDAIQYTPVSHDISSWQLYHGPGFWAPVAFPIDAWFTVRIAFAGTRADAFVGDLAEPALRIRELKRGVAAGGIGILVGGPGLRLARFAYADMAPALADVPTPGQPAPPGVLRDWEVSDPFPEAEVAGPRLRPDWLARRTWRPALAEESGLLDLSRFSGVRDGRNTVLARTRLRSRSGEAAPLAFGFSDRVVVFLNGRALYRGDDTYRSRDYRFLGSIGFWDQVYLPLATGDNELVMAVSEDFGGWGVQARFAGDRR
jgi:hypothetical protein